MNAALVGTELKGEPVGLDDKVPLGLLVGPELSTVGDCDGALVGESEGRLVGKLVAGDGVGSQKLQL